MDKHTFISAMRRVAQSVTVVTTDGIAGRHGATVSAFCSVSADPPTALVCLNASSKICSMVQQNVAFKVNVLPERAQYIADRFAGVHDRSINDRFEGIDVAASGIPSIPGATVFDCSLVQSVISGSHRIMIGHVESVDCSDVHPLAYVDGQYHRLTPLHIQ